ncbi:MAG TPA: acyltransferase family protein [Caldilinea sp.]|nr:acyltransferase family protein [Caldilinea sp.]
MDSTQTQAIGTPRTTAQTAAITDRLYFVDHLRAALVILVVVHHVAVVYGASAPYYYVDPPPGPSLASLILFVFVLFNQAWFMGALFLLAGYFTPAAYDRKGAPRFLKDRLLRLSIPLIFFMFVLGPITAIGLFLPPAPVIPIALTWENFWRVYPDLIGLGPLWFVALLLVFSLGYIAWRQLVGHGRRGEQSTAAPPRLPAIALFIVALAAASYLMRIVVPMGRTVLDFPTLAYLPQYLSFFVLGVIAWRRDWLRTLPTRLGWVGLGIAVVSTLLLFPIPLLGILGGTFRFLGNGSWSSAVYALWDSAFAVGLVLASITLFRRYFGSTSTLGTFLAQQSYAVYIIHSTLIVIIAYGLYLAYARVEFDPGTLLKFAVGTILVVPASYAAAWLVRRLPGVGRIM